MDKDEFLRLIKKFNAEQYDSEEEYFEPEYTAISLGAIAKERMYSKIENGVADLTNDKMVDIKSKSVKYTNFKVGNFSIKIRCKANDLIDVTIYELLNKIDKKVNVKKDDRFINAGWYKYFNSNFGYNVPKEELSNILKWIQSIQKMSAFI